MPARVLEAVPNFSEGRDRKTIGAIRDALRTAGADLLDDSADPDHNRSVFTLIGSPEVVEAAVFAAARIAVERIDLRRHRGVHPRIGALDVLPLVPLAGMTMREAAASAHRVGRRLADELGLPVFFYAHAADPPGRGLASIRRGGFEALAYGWPPNRAPDLLPDGWPHPGAHPTAGAVCVGARRLLLAWNVYVEAITVGDAAAIAAEIRERGGGFTGLRALAFELPEQGALQISMNLEDLEATPPMAVFRRIEELAAERGGHVTRTEVIGMLPDGLVVPAAAERLRLGTAPLDRSLSGRIVEHLTRRGDGPGDEPSMS